MPDEKTRSNLPSSPYVLFFAMLTIGMGQTVIYAVMPALGRELQLDQIVISIAALDWQWQPGKLAITSISAMTAFVFAIVAPYWGRKSDQLGRKPIILLGLIGYTLGTFLFNSIAHIGLTGALAGVALWMLLLLSRIVHAVIMSATFPASSAYMIDITDVEKRAGGLGKISASNQMGVLLGPALAGAVIFGFLTPLYIQAAMTFIAAVLVYFYLQESNLPAAKSESDDVASMARLKLLDRRYLFILPVGLLIHMMQGMATQTLGFYCEDVAGLSRVDSVQYYALAMMASSISMLAVQLTIVQRARFSATQLMRIGLPFCALGYGIIAMNSSIVGVFAGMAIFGAGIGMTMPGYSTFASLTVTAKEQGNLAGITGTVAGLGFVIGPLLGGYVYNFSANAPFEIAATSLALLSVYILLSPRFRQPSA